MATTKEDIRGWLEKAKEEGATHLIVACDTFDHDDYPVSVKPGEDVQKKYSEYNGKNMQRVMEVYDLSVDLEQQLSQHRVWNVNPAPVKAAEPPSRVVKCLPQCTCAQHTKKGRAKKDPFVSAAKAWMDGLAVTTTSGEKFTGEEHAQLAALIHKRFGWDDEAALAAWRRLFGNSTTMDHFQALSGLQYAQVKRGLR